MGNTSGKGNRGVKETFRFKRSVAKSGKLDERKTNDDSSLITHQQKEEQETTQRELCVQSLHKNIARFESDLERLDKTTLEEKREIGSLVQLLLETNEDNEESKDDIILRLTNVMKNVADNLKEIQKPHQLIDELRFTFSSVRHDIKGLEQFGKDVTIRYNHNDNHVFTDIGNIRKKKQKSEKVKRPKHRVAKQAQLKEEMQLREVQSETPVQLFNIHESSVMTELVKELKIMLNRKLGTVNFIPCPNASDIDQEELLIIVCIRTTRLCADAARAIKDIRNPDNAALLIIHVTEAHCLPTLKSSIHLTDEEFKNLRGVFDMAFKSGNGFFHCDMNDKSLRGLSSFCQKQAYGEKHTNL